ncbi:hypothetical protein [Helicobacter ibis]|uniref:MBOAT family protein n=1 Tax=Helicobacter ibis TaxID=2962633 RepID=A0ABT4VD02_9HELI|nr:hypothetical protein [Helicobacter ibis]MDA3968579.1 hypothetical protein [Helicobacter ibis]MDA3968756.1 hypothetical protein [Helicobacter ibis]
MLFSSYIFIFAFLPIMLIGFYILRFYNFVYAKVFLLCGSLFFYGFWNFLYLPLLLFSIIINFLLHKSILSAGGGQNID